MKKFDIGLAIVIITFTMMACSQKKQQVASVQPTKPKSEAERVKEQNKTISNSQNQDCTAIGNIYLNITREEFESQRKIFMKETPELGGLKINSVNGLFYDDRLAAVQIISQQQDYHKKGGIAIDGWYLLYHEKYGNQHKSNRYKFDFEKGMKAIAVTDLSASDKPFSSFEHFMDNPLKECYTNEKLFSEDYRNSLLNIIALMNKLPKSRKKYYDKKIEEVEEQHRKANPELPDYSYIMSLNSIYEEARKEVNAIIERNNEINSEKHKNDPSWSVIIVAYLPLCDKYDNDKRIKESKINHSKEAKRQKELNKI